jgi:hypothetical protein
MTARWMVKSKPLLQRMAFPEKWKGGRIEKFFNYWKNVGFDYKEATNDVINGCKNRPLKATFYASIGFSMWYLNRTNPNEHHFNDTLIRVNHELTLVPDSNRNRVSQDHFDKVVKCQNSDTLRFTNLGIATLVWQDNYSSKAGLYTAQCEYLQPTFKEMISERLIDIGIHGKWRKFEEALKEYDVNIDEWDEQGKPKNSSDQLKPLW